MSRGAMRGMFMLLDFGPVAIPITDAEWLVRDYEVLLRQQKYQIPANENYTTQQIDIALNVGPPVTLLINSSLEAYPLVAGAVTCTVFNEYAATGAAPYLGPDQTYAQAAITTSPTSPYHDYMGAGFRGRIRGVVNYPAPTSELTVVGLVKSDTFYEVGFSYTDWIARVEVGTHPTSGAPIPVAADGTFDVYFDGDGGTIGLRLLRNGVMVGEHFLSGVDDRYYQNLEATLAAVTDTEYPLEAKKVSFPGTSVVFDSTNTAKIKVVRLRNTATGQTLSYASNAAGLPRSFNYLPGEEGYAQFLNRTYAYDCGISLLAMLAMGKGADADRTAERLVEAQRANGAWSFSFNLASLDGDPYYRTGAIAWAVYAMARYARERPASAAVLASIKKGAEYLLSQSRTEGLQNGLLGGGQGIYGPAPGYVFDPLYVVPWCSTEHNIDAYAAFREVVALNLDPTLNTNVNARMGTIKTALRDLIWDGARGCLRQGVSSPTALDEATALDCMTWGAYHWLSTFLNDRAVSSMDRISLYAVNINGVKGYTPYIAADGYPNTTPTVWPEGTYGAAIGFYKLGDVARSKLVIAEINKLRAADDMLPYSSIEDTNYEVTTRPAVISVAWDVLARTNYPLWDGGSTPTNTILTESGEELLTESGETILTE